MAMDEKELYINFDEYIRQGEPSQREAAYAWSTAIGLQAVDGLKTSDYLNDLARRNIEGEITIDEVDKLLDSYYQSKTTREADDDDKEEADRASKNIKRILSIVTLDFTTNGLISIHRRIFDGVFKHAGELRKYDITKKEWVLDGDTVLYASCSQLQATLEYDLAQEKQFDYTNLALPEAIRHIADFVANIWQIHPFREGNTRTTAIFTIKYLRSIGFKKINNDLFEQHSWYFRNALVRANYKNVTRAVNPDSSFLVAFFRNLLLNEQTPLHNRDLHISLIGNQSAIQSAVQSANAALSKSNNCTLEEMATLQIIQRNPRVTQKQIAAEIGKSERTVKTVTVNLTQKGMIVRRNGKRDGYWEILM